MSEKSVIIENILLRGEIKLLKAQIAIVLSTLQDIVVISDRKHDAWDKAHQLIREHNDYQR